MRSGALFAFNALINLAFGLALSWVLPADIYGAFMVCFTVSLLVGNLVYDWARVALLRFYTGAAGDEQTATRRALDFGFAGSVLCCFVAVGVISVLGILPNQTLFTAPALVLLSTSQAAFEYLTTLCRARFDDASYARMIFIRNAVLLGAALPLIAYLGSLDAALTIYGLGILPSVIYGALRQWKQPSAISSEIKAVSTKERPRIGASERLSRIGTYIAYSAPLMAAEVIYMLIAVINRAWLAHTQGAAESGSYALTFDLAFRALAVTASIGDVVLFPRLVQRAGTHGREAARRLTARNIAVMTLVLLPAATGIAITAPNLADMVLAPRFRIAFDTYAPFAAVAALLYALQSYALRPAFQMELRSADPFIAACLALVVNCAVLSLISGPGLYVASTAQVAGLFVGLAVLGLRVSRLRLIAWPLADFARIGVATLLMAIVVLAMPILNSAIATVGIKVAAGAIAFAAAAFALNAAGFRGLGAAWAPRLAPLSGATEEKHTP